LDSLLLLKTQGRIDMEIALCDALAIAGTRYFADPQHYMPAIKKVADAQE
jgi:hypothetical protein